MKITAALALGLTAAFRLCGASTPLSTHLSTYYFPIPSVGSPYTSTIPACDTVPAVVLIGVPNATVYPGTATILLPPQASATTTTFIDWYRNLTEVIIATPLPGTCAPLLPSISAAATVDPRTVD
ncbi:hypothetical protein F4677DRAFT_443929 [Hypoxylon crocopeplum]|nr:hypothetical protein F4677DRAFT_443929 [Hypoxylon crocopeplum]